jgi:uncharacterized protein (TIGR02594 family)
MGFFVNHGIQTDLFSEPTAISTSKELLPPNRPLGDPVRHSEEFLFFVLGAPDDDALKGWVLKSDCEDRADDVDRPLLREAGFVQECVNVQLLFNATDEIKPKAGATPAELMQPWGISCDFLIARALFETGIKNLGRNIPDSDGVGPLQVTIAEWTDFTDNGGMLSKDARTTDRNHPIFQIDGAAFRQHVHAREMNKIRLAAGKVTVQDPFIPSFLHMFLAHVTNSPAAALAILDAQAANLEPNAPIANVIKNAMTPAELTAVFKAREKLPGTETVFFGTETAPNTLKAVVDLAESTLKALLTSAFEKIRTHRPDMMPTVTAGATPWMMVAEQDMAAGIKEGTHDDTIKRYFLDTDHPPIAAGAKVPAWCGAFMAHCMKSSGNPIVAASVPKGAAGAANWSNWGAELPRGSEIPRGAIIVLSPPPDPPGGTAHVGCFRKFSEDEKDVILLGGNQSNQVTETPFLASRIAAIRWLDVPAATGAVVGGITLPSRVAAANRPMAALILNAFAAAGYGRFQQIAALANAIDESALDPNAHAVDEGSVGLFQCRQIHGVGGQHSVEKLKDPDFNTQLIIAEARKVPFFATAKNLRDAVDLFVRFVERPKHPAVQSLRRFSTAQALIA